MADEPRRFGPYLLLKALGAGGMGDVHLARPLEHHPKLPELLVVKRLHGQLSSQEDFVRRFRHEAIVAVTIDSPHVAKVYDVGRVDDTFYMAMEYIAGWTLYRLLKDLGDAGRSASPEAAVGMILGALEGLIALHETRHPESKEALGFVHRDISPKNLMVGEDGITRLIDLGLGKSRLQEWRTSTGVVMGSPGYMAPEQAAGLAVDQRTDVYAMGIVLWEILTGAPYIKRGPVPLMFRAQAHPELRRPSSVRPDLPAVFDEILARALAPEPDSRFATARELSQALRTALPEAKKDQDAVLALVGELLWGELGSAKTEATQLLEQSLPTLDPAAPAPSVEIFAAVETPAPAPQPGPPIPATLQPSPLVRPAPVAAHAPPAERAPRRSAIPLPVVVGLMALMLALGLGVGLVYRSSNNAPVVEPAPEPEPRTITVELDSTPPSATPVAAEVSPEPESPRIVDASPPARSTRTDRRKAEQEALPKKNAGTLTPEAKTPPPAASAPTAVDQPEQTPAPSSPDASLKKARALLSRASTYKESLAQGSDARESVGAILGEIGFEMDLLSRPAADVDEIDRRVRAIEAKLKDLGMP